MERKLENIDEVAQLELSYCNRVSVYLDNDDYSLTGALCYGNEEEFRWIADITEYRDFKQTLDPSVDEALMRAQLKKWGVKPSKIKWEMRSSGHVEWEDCLRAITNRTHCFYYTEYEDIQIGLFNCIMMTAVSVTFDTKERTYQLSRNRFISGDSDAVRDMFVKCLTPLDSKAQILVSGCNNE